MERGGRQILLLLMEPLAAPGCGVGVQAPRRCTNLVAAQIDVRRFVALGRADHRVVVVCEDGSALGNVFTISEDVESTVDGLLMVDECAWRIMGEHRVV